MGTIEFKHVGKLATEQPLTGSALPLGIKTPLQLGAENEGIFTMYFSLEDQIHDNLRNLLLTDHGQRLGLADFGANLTPLTLDFTAIEAFDTEAIIRIRDAVGKYMPFVGLRTFETRLDRFNNQDTGKLILTIIYDVPQINIVNKAIDVVLHVI